MFVNITKLCIVLLFLLIKKKIFKLLKKKEVPLQIFLRRHSITLEFQIEGEGGVNGSWQISAKIINVEGAINWEVGKNFQS